MKNVFVCLDCESTGLDVEKEAIIEFAAVKFTLTEQLESMETLIDPARPIPPESTKIHHITDDMVAGKPKIGAVLPAILEFIGDHPVVGHGIAFDINIITASANRLGMAHSLQKVPLIDTLRLARLYGGSAINSLEALRRHFNILPHGAHRAMSDVQVNIEVFKHLSKPFRSTHEILERLKKPIAMPTMPLGKHKGRRFNEIPIEYLRWAANQDFDQDLIFSLRSELKTRKQGDQFMQAGNPFSEL
jgi:DNA polymerase-3 subunit epsilon